LSSLDDEHAEAVRARFARTAALVAEREEGRREELREQVRAFVQPTGDERVLDSGTGTGALAFAIAPLVREVVGVDLVPELLEEARRRAREFPNVSFVEGDATGLPFEAGSFDLAGSVRTLHHVARPERAVSELTRVTRPGGLVLVVDQIAPVDPLAAVELNRFERARDASHTRALADIDLRALFEANDLVLRRAQFKEERRDLDWYLDLAGCEGEARERAVQLAPRGYTATIGWYLAVRPGLGS
jgi:ubiquinone/menaquinone biosynthesis C-methylase UbiE